MGAVALGFTLGLVVTYSMANPGRRAAPLRLADLESSSSTSFDVERPSGSQMPASAGMRLASLEVPVSFGSPADDIASPEFARPLASSSVPFLDERLDSFDRRFDGAFTSYDIAPARASEGEETADTAPPPPSPELREKATAPASGRAMPKPAASTPLPAKKPVRIADLSQDLSSLYADGHTAIYDISARMVYMPNGRRLEAHSGLGDLMDDTRAISVKSRGPTPPNVYDLTLREELFHGVRAIRLNPFDESKMFGRDGILAHTYMLGPNGQSNGCVSFNDYNAFLNAYLRGEVTRMVVVEHLGNAPTPQTASQWFADTIKDIFWRS
jgi:hypothetical protein